MAKRPAAKPTQKVTPTETPAATGTASSPADVIAAWASGRDALRLVAASAAAAEEALAKLPEDATAEARAAANETLLTAREAVLDVIAAFDKLPDLPFVAALFSMPAETDAPTLSADRLESDQGADPETLQSVTVKGPADGRWRLGRRFTPEAQTLRVSAGTLAKLKADPLLAVAAAD